MGAMVALPLGTAVEFILSDTSIEKRRRKKSPMAPKDKRVVRVKAVVLLKCFRVTSAKAVSKLAR